MTALLFALLTVLSTSAGGLLALRLGARLHRLTAVAAGALLGVVCFELLPEALELARRSGSGLWGATLALGLGGLLFHVLEAGLRGPAGPGALPAAALVGHSLLDGIGLGLAFQVSPDLGLATAAAVTAHDFCDGLNTVRLMLARHHPRRCAAAMLALNALAPIAGAASTLALQVPAGALMLGLAGFAGVLLHIAVAELLPLLRTRAAQSIAPLLLGLGAVHAATRWAG